MKNRMIIFAAALLLSATAHAQTISDWSKWFDGKVLYYAHVLDNGEVYFDAPENTDDSYCFSLRKVENMAGEYVLIPYNLTDEAPLRAQFGWRVQYIRKEGMYFLAVRNGQDEIVWTLVLTPDNLDNCLAQQKFARQEPIEEMLDGYLMNTAFIADVPKADLRRYSAVLESRQGRSVVEETNLQLIRSEIKVVESERRLLVKP